MLEQATIYANTCQILLLVYVIYLMFQLKSHAYLYESTPQHIVDAEAVPGPAAGWLDSSSSEDSSSSSSDSDDSNSSRDTVRKRMKKVLRGRRRRKSSIISQDTNGEPRTRSSSFATNNTTPQDELASQPPFVKVPGLAGSSSTMEKDDEVVEEDASYKPHKKGRRHHRKHRKSKKRVADDGSVNVNAPNLDSTTSKHMGRDNGEPRRVDFAIQNAGANGNNESTNNDSGVGGNPRNPFLRGISVKNLAPTVFVQKPELDEPVAGPSGPVPRVRYGIRRTNSLPDRLRNHQHIRPPGAMMPAHIPLMALTGGTGAEPAKKEEAGELHLSRTASIILLLVSTGLVALCAEFLIGSIEEVVETSSIGEIFIGLIILPIVGNAAEHVTAITVAMKNKMDLAIGVAVGSSIQIAIFVTPLVVILGWIMDRDMTLYFTLFETVCLFVSAFMVNFLVLDGRSNYLEGALLCAVYLIIAVVAFFYPDGADASSWGE
jgi:Ca2+/H+ antiporter